VSSLCPSKEPVGIDEHIRLASEKEVTALKKGDSTMQNDKSVMKYESVLPPDFDGVFRFSNPSDEDFIGIWGNKEYLFPAGTTVPLIITEHTPVEIQNIRKKFAKDLAEREFYKSKSYRDLQGQEGKSGNRNFNSIHQAGAYTLSDLEPYIQKCLKPLPASELLTKPANKVKPVEDSIHKNDNGTFTTEAIDSKTSLRNKALNS